MPFTFTTTGEQVALAGTFNPNFTDATGTFAGGTTTGNYTRIGNMLFYCVAVEFNGYTNLGTGQYQISLPFPAKQNIKPGLINSSELTLIINKIREKKNLEQL